jgi:hypothetical protein
MVSEAPGKMSRKLFFVLGAQDPEMRGIEEILRSCRIPFAHAAVNNQRCSAANAYEANSTVLLGLDGVHRAVVRPPNHDIVLVECAVKGLSHIARVDHHHDGDPGFDAPPARYLDGSSLGQVMKLLELAPTETQRLLAAADHCLSAAYRGACPGVEPSELLFMRAAWQAKMTDRSLGDVITSILRAAEIVNRHFNDASGEAVFLDPTRVPRDLPEGGAYAGKAIRYQTMDRGVLKEMIKGSSSAAIERFMAHHQQIGRRVYGNPHRGYAGAYL